MFCRLCETCDVYPSNIVDIESNCSASGLIYLTAGLVYSSPDGRITANTLITGLQIRLLSQDSTSFLVNDTSVLLSKQCAPQLNNATQSACVQQLKRVATQEIGTTDTTTFNSPATLINSPSYTISVVGGFLGGLSAGAVIATFLITSVIWYARRYARDSDFYVRSDVVKISFHVV